MKKKLIPFLLMVFVAFMVSCVSDDLDDLQSQINDLNDQVEELEQSQQEALLAAIATLQEQIAALESENTTQYQALLESLQLLEEEVANNEAAVYYGNLLTDEDFAAFLAQGATIVTGKVIATTQTQIDAMVAIKMVGGNLTISGGLSIELSDLQNVGGSLVINGVTTNAATVTLSSLISVGENLFVRDNSALTSVTADALVLINNKLHVENNNSLVTLSFASLDLAENVYINEYWMDSPDYSGAGPLNTIDLSGVNIIEDFYLAYISGGELEVGTIANNFTCEFTKLTSLTINSDSLGGDFTLHYSGDLETIDVSAITKIAGDVSVSFMTNSWYEWMAPSGLEVLPAFASLVSIGGDVSLTGNEFLTSLEIFNNVTEFTGSTINLSDNGGSGTGLTLIGVFNSLETGGPNTYTRINISASANTDWFNSFASLLNANHVYLAINGIMDQSTYTNGPTKISGFDALTECRYLNINAVDANEFTAFTSLDNFNTSWQETNCLDLIMPSDASVGLCSMDAIFTKILNGDFDSKPAIFRYDWSEMDKVDAINQLTASCL